MRLFPALLALALVPFPAAGEETPSAVDTPASNASPQEDLDCALFVSFILGSLGEEADAAQAQGLIAGVAYFAGRWERATGEDITVAMPSRYSELELSEFLQLGETCGRRMETFGNKLQVAGAAVAALAEEQN